MKTEIIFLGHILESIEKIEHTLKGLSEQEFVNNTDKQDIVVRRLEIIGEAVKHIPQRIKNKNLGIPWKEIVGTRDILIHAYFSIDWRLVWDITKNDIPKLKEVVKEALAEYHA